MDFTTRLAEIHVVGTEDSAIEPYMTARWGAYNECYKELGWAQTAG